MSERRGAQTHMDVAAFHEAGHAVMALLVGRPVLEARIFRRTPGSGRMRYSPCRPACGYDLLQGPGAARALWALTQEQILNDIRMLLAGPLAEAKAVGKPLRSLGGRSDFQQCTRAVERLDGHWHVIGEMAAVPRPEPARILNQERARVRRSIGRPNVWSLIERLAHYLAENPAAWPKDIARELEAEASPPGQLPLGLGPPPPIKAGKRRHVPPPLRSHASEVMAPVTAGDAVGALAESRAAHARPAAHCSRAFGNFRVLPSIISSSRLIGSPCWRLSASYIPR